MTKIDKQNCRPQRGGTLLGLIIGLIIGLAIAVIVALIITKGATPFTNKSGKQEKAVEPTIGQISDPNKPLYGNKEAAKEAAKDFLKDPDEGVPSAALGSDGKPDPKTAKKAGSGVESNTELKDSQEKITKTDKTDGAQVEHKDNSKDIPPKGDVADDKSTYYLQAGAFREQSDAEGMRAKLALLGVESRVTDRPSDSGNMYRVRIGPFNQVDAMNRVRNKLSENGVDVAVVRNPK